MENAIKLRIELLCKDICDEVKDISKVNENCSIEQLRQICGKSECGYRGLTPAQKLSSLLKVVNRNYLTDLSIGMSIINNYNCFSHENHCLVVLEHIFKQTLRNQVHNESREAFLKLVWQHPAFSVFTIDVVEEFLFTKSKFIEEAIINAYECVLNGSTKPAKLWNTPLYERIVLWGSKSPKVFCLVTSILNVWLKMLISSTNHSQKGLSVVSQFVHSIKTKCSDSKSDFVLLYPIEYQSLVALLDISPCVFPEHSQSQTSVTLSTVVNEIQNSLRYKPVQTACLLSHFPEWAVITNR